MKTLGNYPEFADTPPALVPWPYRPDDAPLPIACPKCGRTPIHYWWGGNGYRAGYHEVACAGWLNLLLYRRPGLLFGVHHWEVTVGHNDRPARTGYRYDAETGEPLDGPK